MSSVCGMCSYKKQELFTLRDPLSSPRFLVWSVLLIFLALCVIYYVFLRSEFRVVMSVTMFGSSLPPVVCRLVSYLRYLCLFADNGVLHMLWYVFVLFVFDLCTLCCQFLRIVHFDCPSVFSITFIYIYICQC